MQPRWIWDPSRGYHVPTLVIAINLLSFDNELDCWMHAHDTLCHEVHAAEAALEAFWTARTARGIICAEATLSEKESSE